MKSALRVSFCAFLVLISSFLFSASAYAQQQTGTNTSTGTGCPTFNPQSIDGQAVGPCTYFDAQNVQNMFNNSLGELGCLGWGADTMNPDQYHFCIGDTKTGLVAYRQLPDHGAIGGITHTVVALYSNPPLSTTEYLADMGSNLGIVTPAYAQVSGAGNGVLSPILQVWQVTRNLTYLLFIVVFMVVGFMIMLRQKINAQTVVTVQNAIPGLIIGLFLVTFSYFIAALIVDLAFVGTSLVVSIIKSAGVYTTTTVFDPANNDNILTIMKNLVFNTGNFGKVIPPLQDTFSSIFNTTILGGTGGGILGKIVGGALGGLATIIIGVAIVVQMFRLLFELLKSYVTIMIMTVLGPFMILSASLPGRSSALSGWWRPLLANTLVFPVVVGAFLFAGIFLNASPTFTTNAMPLFGGIQTDILRVLLGFAIILITPGIPKHVKEALKAPDHPIGQHAQEGAAFGAALAGGFGGIAGRRVVNRAYGVAEARVQRAAVAGTSAPGAERVKRFIDTTWSPTRTNAQGHKIHGWRSTAPHIGPWWKPF